MPSNGLLLNHKQTFAPIIHIFTDGEGDRIESRLPFKIFSILTETTAIDQNGCIPTLARYYLNASVAVHLVPSYVRVTSVLSSCNFLFTAFYLLHFVPNAFP